MQAALSLMIERASEEFTLLEVSQRGKVSIGSIYHQFRSKDDLVRAVVERELADIGVIERACLEDLLRTSKTLDEFVPKFVTSYSSLLRDHALVLRLAMRRAATDAKVSSSGDNREHESTEAFAQALLAFGEELTGDAVVKGRMTVQTIFAALARHLSLNTIQPKSDTLDWDFLIRELSIMALSYLKFGETQAAAL